MLLTLIIGIEDDTDRDIILRIYTQHYSIMKSRALRFAKDENTAEDIVQDAMLALIKRVETLRSLSEQQIVAYAVRTVISCAVDNYRRNNRKLKTVSLEKIVEEYGEKIDDKSESIEDQYEQKEIHLKLGAVLNQLPERDKNVLYMKHYFGYSDKEIASTIGVSTGSVRMILTRARNKVKSKLQLLSQQGNEVENNG